MNGWRPLLSDDVLGSSGQASTPPTPVKAVGRPLLCLSDIHGDLWALESVLSAVKSLDLCGIVVCGDHCCFGDQPFEVWTRLTSLGAHLACGPTDQALGALSAGIVPEPTTAAEEARLASFLRTKQALGDVVCRRLADLPSTLVVSLDDTRGVMAMHGSPAAWGEDRQPLLDDDDLAHNVASVAEDVLVTGAGVPFARAVERPDDGGVNECGVSLPVQPLLVVNAGSVGQSPVRRNDGRRTAHAVLLAAGDDGAVHAWGQDILVMAKARARSVG